MISSADSLPEALLSSCSALLRFFGRRAAAAACCWASAAAALPAEDGCEGAAALFGAWLWPLAGFLILS